MTWKDHDLPVLKAIVQMADEGAALIEPHQIVDRLGMNPEDVRGALAALAGEKPPFFQFTDVSDSDSAGREINGIHSPTGEARRVVGMWPAEMLARQIVAGLEAAAEAEPDGETRDKLKQTAKLQMDRPIAVRDAILACRSGGIVSILLGLLVLAWPGPGVVALPWLLGLGAMVTGGLLVVGAMTFLGQSSVEDAATSAS